MDKIPAPGKAAGHAGQIQPNRDACKDLKESDWIHIVIEQFIIDSFKEISGDGIPVRVALNWIM